MDQAGDIIVVMTTLPDLDTAQRIAREVVNRRLAACASVQGPCRSVFRWQGAVEEVEEVALVIKTTQERYALLERELRALHPYELPEILALSAAAGLPPYLAWVADNTN